MSTFCDLDGREWQIKLDDDSKRRVKEGAGVDLDELIASPLFDSINQLYNSVVQVVTCLLQPQIRQQGLTASSFFSAMNGEQWDEALVAITSEIEDSLPEFEQEEFAEAIEAYERKIEERISEMELNE